VRLGRASGRVTQLVTGRWWPTSCGGSRSCKDRAARR